MKRGNDSRTALVVVQDSIMALEGIEKMLLSARKLARASKRNAPTSRELKRITDAILRAEWNHLQPLAEWARHESFWAHLEKLKRRREARARKAKKANAV